MALTDQIAISSVMHRESRSQLEVVLIAIKLYIEVIK
jgi:hypothetical protein